MSTENKYAKLISDHAHWADEVRRLKNLGSNEFSLCTRPSCKQGGKGGNCISDLYFDYKNQDYNPYEHVSYEDFYRDSVACGHVCEHCIAAIELRKQRMIAIRRLGQIRAAITMAGRRLNTTTKVGEL